MNAWEIDVSRLFSCEFTKEIAELQLYTLLVTFFLVMGTSLLTDDRGLTFWISTLMVTIDLVGFVAILWARSDDWWNKTDMSANMAFCFEYGLIVSIGIVMIVMMGMAGCSLQPKPKPKFKPVTS